MSSKQLNTPSILQMNKKQPNSSQDPVQNNSDSNKQQQQHQSTNQQQPSSDQKTEQKATNKPETQQNATNDNQNQLPQQQEDPMTQLKSTTFTLILNYTRTNGQQDYDNLKEYLGLIIQQPSQFQLEINQFLGSCAHSVEQKINEAQDQLEEATQQKNIERKLELTNQSNFYTSLIAKLKEVISVVHKSIVQQTQNEAAIQHQNNLQQEQEVAQNEASLDKNQDLPQKSQEHQEVPNKPSYSFRGQIFSSNGGITKNNSLYSTSFKDSVKKFGWKKQAEGWYKSKTTDQDASAIKGWNKFKQNDRCHSFSAWSPKNQNSEDDYS